MGASAAPRTIFLILDDDAHAFNTWHHAVLEFIDASRAFLPHQACAILQKGSPLEFVEDMAEFRNRVAAAPRPIFTTGEALGAKQIILSAFQAQGFGYYYHLWLFTNLSPEVVRDLLHGIRGYLALTLVISETVRFEPCAFDGAYLLCLAGKSWAELVGRAVEMFYRPFAVILRVGQLAQPARLTQAPGYFHCSEVLDVLGFAPLYFLSNCVGTSWHQVLPHGADTSLIDALWVGLSAEKAFAMVRLGGDGSVGVLSVDGGLQLMILAPDHPLPEPWRGQLNDDLRFKPPAPIRTTDHRVSLWVHRPDKLLLLLCDYLTNLPETLPRMFSLVKTLERAKRAYSLETLVVLTRDIVLRELSVLHKADPSYQGLIKVGKLLGSVKPPASSLKLPPRLSKKVELASRRPWTLAWKARHTASFAAPFEARGQKPLELDAYEREAAFESTEGSCDLMEQVALPDTSTEDVLPKAESAPLSPRESRSQAEGVVGFDEATVESSSSAPAIEAAHVAPPQLSTSPPGVSAQGPRTGAETPEGAFPNLQASDESPSKLEADAFALPGELAADMVESPYDPSAGSAQESIKFPTPEPTCEAIAELSGSQPPAEVHVEPLTSPVSQPSEPVTAKPTLALAEVDAEPSTQYVKFKSEPPVEELIAQPTEPSVEPSAHPPEGSEPNCPIEPKPDPLPQETGRITRSKTSAGVGVKRGTPAAVVDNRAPVASKFAKRERKPPKTTRPIDDAASSEAPAAKRRAKAKAKPDPKPKTASPKRKNAKKMGKAKSKEPPFPPEAPPVQPPPQQANPALTQPVTESMSLTEQTKLKLSTFFGKPTLAKKPTAGPAIRPQPNLLPSRPPFGAPAGLQTVLSHPPPPTPTKGLESGPPLRPLTALPPPVGGLLVAPPDFKPVPEAATPKAPKRRGKAKKLDEPEPSLPQHPKDEPKPKPPRAKKPALPQPATDAPEGTLRPGRLPAHSQQPDLPRVAPLEASTHRLPRPIVIDPRAEPSAAPCERFYSLPYDNAPNPAQPPQYRSEPGSYPSAKAHARDWPYYPPSSAGPGASFLPYDPGFQASRGATPARDALAAPHAPILPRSSGPASLRPAPTHQHARPHAWEGEELGPTKSLRHASILTRKPSQYSEGPYFEPNSQPEPHPPAPYPQMAYSSAAAPRFALQPRSVAHATSPHYPFDYPARDYGPPHYAPYDQYPLAYPRLHEAQDASSSMDLRPRGLLQRDVGPYRPIGAPSEASQDAAQGPPPQDPPPNKSSLRHLLN
ncbi:hypothetical protein L0F63_001267 [Massospora cicadina]|nr:hypothetical protein L0F63_001267 [Massospora cicadina]